MINLPVTFILLQRGDSEKLFDCLFGVVDLYLFRIIVFVLDADVTRLVVVFILILKIIPIDSLS